MDDDDAHDTFDPLSLATGRIMGELHARMFWVERKKARAAARKLTAREIAGDRREDIAPGSENVIVMRPRVTKSEHSRTASQGASDKERSNETGCRAYTSARQASNKL